MPCRSLATSFLDSARRFPGRTALEVQGQSLSYAELERTAVAMASSLAAHVPAQGPVLIAVFGYRSVIAFAGVLAALLLGGGYVPLNRTFPVDRTRLMLRRSGCTTMIVDAESEPQLEQVLQGLSRRMVVLLPQAMDVSELASRWPQHHFITGRETAMGPVARSPTWRDDTIAYLLFTSGSTGTPKGVMVSHRNVLHYVDFVVRRYSVTEQDRVSQTFDLTFDLSAHDMFVAWHAGGCVCCPGKKDSIKPGRFIRQARLSIWFSVPSTAVFMRRFGELRPGAYPDLRLSLFCGEALPVELAEAWRKAAPNSAIENLYGPTELTIACTAYRWDGDRSLAQCEQSLVPIGSPFDDMEAVVVRDDLSEVEPGEDGELVMTGPQLSLGYWQDEERTARAFVTLPGREAIYYRTGDRVRRPLPDRPMVYLGRIDHQVKILGHRVELGEIEAVVRKLSGVDGVVALGWPATLSGADGVEVFLQTNEVDLAALRDALGEALPSYMVPRAIHLLPEFPLNANGKYDRTVLVKLLEGGGGS